MLGLQVVLQPQEHCLLFSGYAAPGTRIVNNCLAPDFQVPAQASLFSVNWAHPERRASQSTAQQLWNSPCKTFSFRESPWVFCQFSLAGQECVANACPFQGHLSSPGGNALLFDWERSSQERMSVLSQHLSCQAADSFSLWSWCHGSLMAFAWSSSALVPRVIGLAPSVYRQL